MKKTFFFASAAALFAFAACNKEVSPVQAPELDGQTINLTLVADRGDDATKTTISYNDNFGSLESRWAAGDKIYVYSAKSGDELGTLSIDASSITNEGGGSTSYAPTSKASFAGSVTLGGGDNIKDDFVFVYQGQGRSLSVSEGLLEYPINTVSEVANLAQWDLAWAKGKIQGSASSASCAVSFGNKIGFGYFTTTSVPSASSLKAQYYESFTLDVKTGTIAGVAGDVALPDNANFYMPLVPGTVNINCGRQWSAGSYTEIAQENAFTAGVGFYRHGRNADPAFGPVQFVESDLIVYDNLASKSFKVAADKSVRFTPGNLQYIGSKAGKEHWQLAPSQYSVLGQSNAKPANADPGATFTGDLDLFGWGEVAAPFKGSNQNSEYMPSISTGNVQLPADNDWATKFNAPTSTKLYIDYSKDVEYTAAGSYITLTKDQWVYLFANQQFALCQVTLDNGTKVNGVAVAPNGIDAETFLGYGFSVAGAGSGSARFTDNLVDQRVIDSNGLLFLPAAGYRLGTSINNVGSNGNYWSSTSYNATNAYSVDFVADGFNGQNYWDRFRGFSVRLASEL